VDVAEFDVAENLDDYEERAATLRAEREAYLAAFEDLSEDIRDAVY